MKFDWFKWSLYPWPSLFAVYIWELNLFSFLKQKKEKRTKQNRIKPTAIRLHTIHRIQTLFLGGWVFSGTSRAVWKFKWKHPFKKDLLLIICVCECVWVLFLLLCYCFYRCWCVSLLSFFGVFKSTTQQQHKYQKP